MGCVAMGHCVTLLLTMQLALLAHADLNGEWASEWGETIVFCDPTPTAKLPIFGEYQGNGYNGWVELQWVDATQRYEGQFVSTNGVGEVWWKQDPTDSTKLDGGWAFLNGVFGSDNSGSWTATFTVVDANHSTGAVCTASPPSLEGKYTESDFGTFQMCHPVWQPGFSRQVPRTILQGEFKQDLPNGPSNGVYWLIYKASEGKFKGRFNSVKGGGTIEWDENVEGAWIAETAGSDLYVEGVAATSGYWNLTLSAGNVVEFAEVCGSMLTAFSHGIDGKFLSEFNEDIHLCTPAFNSQGLGVTLQGEYQGDGYNGLAYLVYTPTEKMFIGKFESQNGIGNVWWYSDADGSGNIAGSWGFVNGDYEGSSDGSWNATQTDVEVESAICSDFRTSFPSIDGTYISEYDETIDLCAATGEATIGVIQASYVGAGYNGLAWLIYKPTAVEFVGFFESQNGLGGVTFSGDNTDGVTGTYSFSSGSFQGEGGGSWNLGVSQGEAATEVCTTLYRNIPSPDGVYLTNFDEDLVLCSPEGQLLRPVTAQYTGTGSVYNGVATLLWNPEAKAFSGTFVSQSGAGYVRWSLLENGDLDGTWGYETPGSTFSFDDATATTGQWTAVRQSSISEAMTADPTYSADKVCQSQRDFPSYSGTYGTSAETITLCNPMMGVIQGTYADGTGTGVTGNIFGVFNPILDRYNVYWLGDDGKGTGYWTQSADNDLTGTKTLRNTDGTTTTTTWNLPYDSSSTSSCSEVTVVRLDVSTDILVSTPSASALPSVALTGLLCVLGLVNIISW